MALFRALWPVSIVTVLNFHLLSAMAFTIGRFHCTLLRNIPLSIFSFWWAIVCQVCQYTWDSVFQLLEWSAWPHTTLSTPWLDHACAYSFFSAVLILWSESSRIWVCSLLQVMYQSYVHIPSVEQGKAIIVALGVERAGLSHFGIIGCYVCVVRVCACVCVCVGMCLVVQCTGDSVLEVSH